MPINALPVSTCQRLASNDWQPFTGEYEKQFYEVRGEGDFVIKHLWPNAGKLFATDGQDLEFTPAMRVHFRPCTCGHKRGGCLQPEAEG